MYALFPAEFRQAFGLPQDFKSILEARFGSFDSSEPLLLNDLAPAAAAADLASTDVLMTEAVTSVDVTMEDALGADDEMDFMAVVGPPSTDKSPALTTMETDDIAAAVVVVATQICSLCSKGFEKSKSHQGTRCWSCKKKSQSHLAGH